MTPKYKLQEKDGLVFVTCDDVDYFEPEGYRLWWPILDRHSGGQLKKHDIDLELLGRELESGGDGGRFVLIHHHCPINIYLLNGGKTESVHMDKWKLESPKARVKVRWNYGRWEKCLKKGWVVI